MNRILTTLTATLALLSITGCSSRNVSSYPSSPVDSLELVLSRASLAEVEFEHYKFTGATLFKECGTVNRGRYVPEEQDVREVRNFRGGPVAQQARSFVGTYRTKKWTWDEPGTHRSLADPGEVRLSLNAGSEKIKVATSLDSISDPRSSAERALSKLVRSVRGVAGGKMCGNAEFYGLGYLPG
jgi:hypothetical protein